MKHLLDLSELEKNTKQSSPKLVLGRPKIQKNTGSKTRARSVGLSVLGVWWCLLFLLSAVCLSPFLC